MSDLRTLVELEMDRAGTPSYSFIDLRRGQARRQRRRRLGTIGVAVAISAAAGVLVGRSWFAQDERTAGEPIPSPVEKPTSRVPLTIFEGMWPQETIGEAREAQHRADAGDPGVRWQLKVDPVSGEEGDEVGAEIATRFVEQELGWEHYHSVAGSGSGGRAELVFIRCEPGATNALYPLGQGSSCAPTIDAFRYETVRVRITQPVDQGRGGIWVVTLAERLPASDEPVRDGDWHSRQYEQVTPASEEELRSFVEAFLAARVTGEGAEPYLVDPSAPPLLYATSEGLAYDRAEIEGLDRTPHWPDGEYSVTVRLYADAGGVEVAQSFALWPEDDRLRLEYRFESTYENDIVLPEVHGILGGQVTFDVGPGWFSPWFRGIADGDESILVGGVPDGSFVVLSEPAVPVPPGCGEGVPASADELAAAIQDDPDLVTNEEASTVIGGVDAVRLDVIAAPGAEICRGAQFKGTPVVTAHQQEPGGGVHPLGLRHDHRMRVYVLEMPSIPTRTLSILIFGPEESFDELLQAAAPIIDSVRFAEA